MFCKYSTGRIVSGGALLLAVLPTWSQVRVAPPPIVAPPVTVAPPQVQTPRLPPTVPAPPPVLQQRQIPTTTLPTVNTQVPGTIHQSPNLGSTTSTPNVNTNVGSVPEVNSTSAPVSGTGTESTSSSEPNPALDETSRQVQESLDRLVQESLEHLPVLDKTRRKP